MRVIGVCAGLVLSLFLAINCAAAEPAAMAVKSSAASAAEAQAENRHCLIHRQEGNGIGLVLPGAPGVPSPAPRTGTAVDDPAVTADGKTSATVTAPRTARQAVPLTRSGELPVALAAFRC
ncbi:hypothetical protein ACFWVC_28325 [Streptomyces sp. NPDC058691]|uniref:hypothetical protein n=1 Tax=Streptomyces sp. NPDC058691 TaxID=3346601 RepID=UPI0036658E79